MSEKGVRVTLEQTCARCGKTESKSHEKSGFTPTLEDWGSVYLKEKVKSTAPRASSVPAREETKYRSLVLCYDCNIAVLNFIRDGVKVDADLEERPDDAEPGTAVGGFMEEVVEMASGHSVESAIAQGKKEEVEDLVTGRKTKLPPLRQGGFNP